MNNLRINTVSHQVVLPFYIGFVWVWKTKSLKWAIKIEGKSHPDDLNRPVVSRTVYVSSDYFAGMNAQQMANTICHRMRYYSKLCEAQWDYYALIRFCRNYRKDFKNELREIAQTAYLLDSNWKTKLDKIANVKSQVENLVK